MITADVRSAAFGHGWTLDRFRPDGRIIIERGDIQIIKTRGLAARAYRGNALMALLYTPSMVAEFLRTTPTESEMP